MYMAHGIQVEAYTSRPIQVGLYKQAYLIQS